MRFSAGSHKVWSAVMFCGILAVNSRKSGSCEMSTCISTAQARTKCLALRFIVLHNRSIRGGDRSRFVRLVLSCLPQACTSEAFNAFEVGISVCFVRLVLFCLPWVYNPKHSMRARCSVLCCLALPCLPKHSIHPRRGSLFCCVCFLRLVLSSICHPCVESLRLREMSCKAIRGI